MKSRNFLLSFAAALVVLVFTGSASAVLIIPAGSDTEVGEFIRTTTFVKPIDDDGDNVYGTDGYFFFATSPQASGTNNNGEFDQYARISLPSYVSAVGEIEGIWTAWGWGYLMIDNPDMNPGPSVNNVESGLLVGGDWESPTGAEWGLLTITLDGDVPGVFRLGVFTNNGDWSGLEPAELILRGPGETEASIAVPSEDMTGDMYFFEIIAGQAGDVFALSGTQKWDAVAVSIGGIVFDESYRPLPALNPDPYDTQDRVLVDKVLSWTTGLDPEDTSQPNPAINKHFVWMNSGAADDPNLVLVKTIIESSPPAATAQYIPVGGLEYESNYIWRVDEGIGDYPAGDPNNIIGFVWSFETVPASPIIDPATPADAIVDAGEDAVFTVVAINPFTLIEDDNLTYQWYRAGEPDVPVGTDSPMLTIPAESVIDGAEYYCKVSVIGMPDYESTSENALLAIKKVMLNVPLDGDANDISGNGYIGVLTGDAAFSTDAVLGQSISLDGNGDYINFGDVTITDSGLISISVWAKPDNVMRNWNAIVAKWAADASTKTFWFGQHDYDGWVRFGIYPDNDPVAENAVDSGRAILENGKWTHIVCSYDGQYQHLFADGLLVATSTERNWLVSDGDGDLCVGHIAQDGGDFQGKVDEVRIYNYQLTSEEVADLYFEAPDKDYVCVDRPQYDFDGDCLVTVNDFVDIAAEWMLCGTYPTCVTEVPD